MNTKKNIKQTIDSLFEAIPSLRPIIEKLIEQTAEVFLVGGVVRDIIMGRTIKDIDIEVHGLPLQELEDVLKQFGPLYDVGKSFGVFRLAGIDIDWSIPRRDSKGRKPKVLFDFSMTFVQAAQRRDVTMNALGINLGAYLEGVENILLDPFGGVKDIEEKTLRAVDLQTFNDDPLRFYRVMQFIARFEMEPDESLNDICKKSYLSSLARERIFEEYKKMFLYSLNPSRGIRWLRSIGRIAECLPEVAMLIDIVQNPSYHPEGDVFEHTMQALDASARLEYRNDSEKIMIMFASLCHDLGKAECTTPDGKSYGHAEAGVPLAYQLIKRLSSEGALVQAVMKLVQYHLMPGQLIDQNSSPRAYKRLAVKLAPNVSLYHLALLATCDMQGRNPNSPVPLSGDIEEVKLFLEKATKAQVAHEKEKPLLLGRDFIEHIPAGFEIGKLVKRAYELQINEQISNRELLWQRVMDEYKNRKS